MVVTKERGDLLRTVVCLLYSQFWERIREKGIFNDRLKSQEEMFLFLFFIFF